MQPCKALMSCHAIRLRQIVNPDNLTCHNVIGQFCVPLLLTLTSGTRRWRRGGRKDETTSDCDGGQRLAADVDTSRSARPLGSLTLFIVSLVRLEKPLRSDTVHLTPHFFSHFHPSCPH